MQDMRTDPASVGALVAPIFVVCLSRLLHFAVEIRYKTVAVLYQAVKKRIKEQPVQMTGKSDSLLHCAYCDDTIGFHSILRFRLAM